MRKQTVKSKLVKYLRIHLNKETQGLYTENNKPLPGETKQDLYKWKEINEFID